MGVGPQHCEMYGYGMGIGMPTGMYMDMEGTCIVVAIVGLVCLCLWCNWH